MKRGGGKKGQSQQRAAKRAERPAGPERRGGPIAHDAERQALLSTQVRVFAQAGWKEGATETNNGIEWRWYRDGSSYVVAGRPVGGGADVMQKFSPADVLRIRATRPSQATSPRGEVSSAARTPA